MEKKDYYKYVGDLAQLSGIKDQTFNEGKAKGVRSLEMYVDNSIKLTVLADRGMDISSLSYKGRNLSFLSKTGIVAPTYFIEDGNKGFFKNFFGGFLTTCGLHYMGASSEDQGEKLGLHGTISNTPAYNVSYSSENQLSVLGKVKEAKVFGEHTVLTRKISIDQETQTIFLEDRVNNLSYQQVPFMILYHFNFGYPFLSPDLEITTPSQQVTPRDELSDVSTHLNINKPKNNQAEEVFNHQLIPNERGEVEIQLNNYQLGIGVRIRYSHEQLPYLTQWKSMASGDYALGIEPGNYHVTGRATARKENELAYIEPMGERKISLAIQLVDL